MTERIEAQIERFAPGFRDCVLARHVSAPATLEAMDANLLGGDISGGALTMRQMFFRPTAARIRDGRAQAVFVLGVDAAGRRRARHVRLPRGAAGAAADQKSSRHRASSVLL
jgi:phytoene dehydrogenase-like protein